MTVSSTARLSLPQWSADTDPAVTRTGLDAAFANIDTLAAIAKQGTLANRPAPGPGGTIYLATDNGHFYYDTGSVWVSLTGIFPTATTSARSTSSPSAGQGEFDTDTNNISTWNGSSWVAIGNPRLLGGNSVITGNPPVLPAGQFYMQAGTSVVTTNSSGGAVISFGTAFPNGVMTVVATASNDLGSEIVQIISSQVSTTGFGLIVATSGNNGATPGPFRVFWIGMGF